MGKLFVQMVKNKDLVCRFQCLCNNFRTVFLYKPLRIFQRKGNPFHKLVVLNLISTELLREILRQSFEVLGMKYIVEILYKLFRA